MHMIHKFFKTGAPSNIDDFTVSLDNILSKMMLNFHIYLIFGIPACCFIKVPRTGISPW